MKIDIGYFKTKLLDKQKVKLRVYSLKDLQELYLRLQEKKSQNKTATSSN